MISWRRQLVGGGGERDARHVRKAFGSHGQGRYIRAGSRGPTASTQCASSIANSASFARREQAEAARRQQPLRGDVEQVEIAGEQALLDRVRLLRRQRRSSAPPP